MRVLVVTEIRLYREGVAASLAGVPDVEAIATASSGAAAVLEARRTEADVVLLDMSLPDSAATVHALITARPAIKVVALGVTDDGSQVIACAEAGIHGYVSRDASLAEVGDAMRSALRGEAACTGRVAAQLIRHIEMQARSRSGDPVAFQLTKRERDVLELLQGGMTNKEIGRALDIELSTVKNHVHQVLTKLGASGRAQVLGAEARAGSPPAV